MCTHYAIRALMNEVAGHGGLDPDRVSFTRSVRERGEVFVLGSVRPRTRSATRCAQRSPRSLASCSLSARVVKRKMSKFRVKRAAHRNWPQPTKPGREAIRVLAAP